MFSKLIFWEAYLQINYDSLKGSLHNQETNNWY